MRIQPGISSPQDHRWRDRPQTEARGFSDSYTANSFAGPSEYSATAFALAAQDSGHQLQIGVWNSATFAAGSSDSSAGNQWTDNLESVPYKCYYCNGSGKCQNDYPGPGSGKDGNGEKEYRCGGSGRCYQCDGDGILLN